jgi:hypothetical protein
MNTITTRSPIPGFLDIPTALAGSAHSTTISIASLAKVVHNGVKTYLRDIFFRGFIQNSGNVIKTSFWKQYRNWALSD